MKNFINGALVFRIWQYGGTGEIVGKFQYYSDAQMFAAEKAKDDQQKRPNDSLAYFYLAVCDYENETKAFFPSPPERTS